MSTSCCVWMAPVSQWTTTNPVTGPGCLLMLWWLGMIARLMTSGPSSQRHRYHHLSFPFLLLFCPLAFPLLSSFPRASIQPFSDYVSPMTGKIWRGHKQQLPSLWATWQEGTSPQRLAFQRLCYRAEAYPVTDGFPALPGLRVLQCHPEPSER